MIDTGKEQRPIHEKDGYKFYEFGHSSSTWSFQDEEIVRENYFYKYLKPGITLIDIGSAYGSYTLPALQRGCAKVISIAPNEQFTEIRMNVELNNFPKNSYDIFNTALYSKQGFLDIDKNIFYKTLDNMEPGSYNNVLTFPCTTLDSLLLTNYNSHNSKRKELKKIDYIKMDVEGSEVEVLKGGINTIKKHKPIMLIENHLFKDSGLQEKVIEYVDSLGLGYKHESSPYHAISHTLFTL